MQVAKAFGASEVCITAHHEGGFALWPSNFSDYGVAASAWKGGKGDIIKEFASAARDAGIKICYYIGPNANGERFPSHLSLFPSTFTPHRLQFYSVLLSGYMISQNYTAEKFVAHQLGEFTELLTNPKCAFTLK